MIFNECIKGVDVVTRRELWFGVESWPEEVAPGETKRRCPGCSGISGAGFLGASFNDSLRNDHLASGLTNQTLVLSSSGGQIQPLAAQEGIHKESHENRLKVPV